MRNGDHQEFALNSGIKKIKSKITREVIIFIFLISEKIKEKLSDHEIQKARKKFYFWQYLNIRPKNKEKKKLNKIQNHPRKIFSFRNNC
jgi:hypothetical protein